MSTQQEKLAAEELVAAYAKILNAADSAAIPSFYTHDGVFMPDGFKTLQTADLVKTGGSYLKKANFQISYDLQEVVVDKGFAFINATAQVTSTDLSTGKIINRSSRDFFVLRKQEQEWKIFRYIFNQQ